MQDVVSNKYDSFVINVYDIHESRAAGRDRKDRGVTDWYQSIGYSEPGCI